MKKTLFLLILLIIAGAAYFFISSKDDNTSINIESRNFIVEDIDDISFLTVKNPGYPLVHLKKESKEQWILNNKYEADMNVVNNMIGVLSHMEIRNIPTKSRNENVIKNLKNVGIEITTFDNKGEILSEVIMGDNDNKEGATYCVRKGYNQSYAMHVKVTEGGLRNYFTQTQKTLRNKNVFNVDGSKIISLKMTYPKDKKNSFEIARDSDKFNITATDQFGRKNIDGNSNIIEAYLKDYNSVNCESIRTDDIALDSIRNKVSFAKLEFELTDGVKHSYEFYPALDLLVKDVNTQSVKDLRKIDRFIVFAGNDEIYIIQRRLVNDLFKPITYFY